MMEFESIVEVQTAAMLKGIEQDLAARREGILEEARREARIRLRAARRHARQVMSAVIAEERDHLYVSLGRANAALASRLRRRQQEFDRAQLQEGKALLRQALLARWLEPAARREWAALLLQEAADTLPADTWTIEYPDSLDPGEAEAMLAAPGRELKLAAVADLRAGLRLRCGSACLDTSIDGLLAQEELINGELLAEIRRQQDREAAP